jgi:hypothetical protein
MALVLVIGVALGWIVRMNHAARIQRDAVAEIRRAGGTVWYDWQWKDDAPATDGAPAWPNWLVDALGIDYFSSVVLVDLGPLASDSVLVHVGRIRRLEVLILTGGSMTDAGLIHLKGLTRLRWLALDRNSIYQTSYVSDAGIENLKSLPNLRRVFLYGPGVTDVSLAHLRGLANLEDLRLDSTRVTAGALQDLQGTRPKLKIAHW